MKFSIVALALCICPQVFAEGLRVQNPKEETVKVLVPIENISCRQGPFHYYKVKVVLPQRIGRPEQRGVLESEYYNTESNACGSVLADLKKLANEKGELELQARVINRSVVKVMETARACVGAQQEIIVMNVGPEDTVYGHVYESHDELPCPEGLDFNRIRTVGSVIYVLHEDGIPTAPEFMKDGF